MRCSNEFYLVIGIPAENATIRATSLAERHFRDAFICALASELSLIDIKGIFSEYCLWEVEFTQFQNAPPDDKLISLMDFNDGRAIYIDSVDGTSVVLYGNVQSRVKQASEKAELERLLETQIVLKAFCPFCSPKRKNRRVRVLFDSNLTGSDLSCAEILGSGKPCAKLCY